MTVFDNLVARARALDPDLGRDLSKALEKKPAFGLVFEDHFPDSVEMPEVRVRKDSSVHLLPPRGSTRLPAADTYKVLSVNGDQLECARVSDDEDSIEVDEYGEVMESVTADRDDVVAIARKDDVFFPGLRFDGAISSPDADNDGPVHAMINAENSHALKLLRFSHAEKIDTVYLDPPYNTLNDSWIYNDRYVSADDDFRHSKWLSFMERRLKLAYELLKPTGVIVVAIGDDEHHRLRMLMDKVFGEQNFIANVVWNGSRKNNSRFVSASADYMLIYAKDKTKWAVPGIGVTDAPDVSTIRSHEITEMGARWRVPKAGMEQALKAAADIWQNSRTHQEANTQFKEWMRAFKATGFPDNGVTRFNSLNSDGEPVNVDGDLTAPGGNGPRYEVLHPITGLPVTVPSRGWCYSDPETMQRMISEGKVHFGPDEKKIPRGVTRLVDSASAVASTVFDRERARGSRHLYHSTADTGVFPDNRFPYPKDHTVLMEWLDMMTPRDGVILDFFGGSGSTLEAVLRLNEENETSERTCILVTNNEVSQKDSRRLRKDGFRPGDEEWERRGVYRHVTRPRIETVLTGKRVDGSPYANTTTGRVTTFTLTYESERGIRRNRAFSRIAGALWLKAGMRGEIIRALPPRGWNVTDTYAVLENESKASEFITAVHRRRDTLRHVFIVTDSEASYKRLVARLPEGLNSTRLYLNYLSTFRAVNN